MKLRSLSACALVSLSVLSLVGCSAREDEDEDGVESTEQAIVGGVEARPGAWPGTVALYKGGSRPSCGGTLVAREWVLTAAHCVTAGSATGGVTRVVIDRHRLSSTVGETRTVTRAIRHPAFNRSTLDNDIALLRLSSPSTAPTAALIGSAQVDAVAVNASTTAVGWGATSQGGSGSDVLRQVSVPVIANATCRTMPQYGRVTANMICAGYRQGTMDACQGDSGGPLFIKIGEKFFEVGLTSWGIGCARPNAPGVYTRVSNYLRWLYDQTDGAVGEVPGPPPEEVPVIVEAPVEEASAGW